MNGDVLTKLDYRELVRYHREQKNLVTIAARAPDQDRLRRPPCRLERRPRSLRRFVEKPESTSRVSMGIYIMEPRALDYIPVEGFFDFPDLVRTLLKAGEAVGVYDYQGLWFDIGRADDYEQAVAAWLASGPGSARPGAGRSPRSRLSVTLASRLSTSASARTTTDRVWRVPLSDLVVDRELEEAVLAAYRSGWWSWAPASPSSSARSPRSARASTPSPCPTAPRRCTSR